MSVAAVKYFGDNIEYMSDPEQFIELLYHNEHNSYAYRNMKSEDGKMLQVACLDKCALLPDNNLRDCWISFNLFKSGKRRIPNNCRELTGFYFDLDKHVGSANEINAAINKTLNLLYVLVSKKILPMPTVITNTGRGLGIYYIFRQTLAVTDNTSKQQKYYQFLYAKMADIFKFYLNKPGLLDMDSVVVNDRTRIVRLPGTYNTAAGKYCSIANIGQDCFGAVIFYDLSDFKIYIEKFENNCLEKVKDAAAHMPIISFIGCKSTFLYNRVLQMKKLQENFNHECTNNRREYMCFVFYNSAKQIYPDAVERLYNFNGNFLVPLKEAEILHVIKSVDENVTDTHKGYYKLTDSWILEKLKLSEEEIKITLIGQSQRKIEREVSKEKTKAKKIERDNKVIELLQNKEYTYEDISSVVNISVSTVKRIAKANNIHRYTSGNNSCFKDKTNNIQKKVTKVTSVPVETEVVSGTLFSKVHFLSQSLVVVCSFIRGVWLLMYVYYYFGNYGPSG